MWVYVLYNQDHKRIYIGQTHNLDQRLFEHNKKRGKHFTANFSGEWKIIYKEEVASRKEALLREKQLKSSRGREYLKQFIPVVEA